MLQESKEETEDKPKRKLPDPDKFTKKPNPTATNGPQGSTGLLAATVSSTSKQQRSPSPVAAEGTASETAVPSNTSPTGSMPPIQATGNPPGGTRSVASSTSCGGYGALGAYHRLDY